MYKKTAIALALASFAPVTFAQSVNENEMEEVVVIGQRGMVSSAIAAQREANTVSSVVTNATFGALPDQNVAEAVRRLPGVNVLDDQGEGRFISVRGMDPELNSATLNGVRLPAPENDTRAVALDVIPSELVQSIEVIKTLTPEMDADTIGATIQINTINATEREEFLQVNALANYNDLNGETSPEFGIDFSRQLSDRLAVAGGFKSSERKTATDNLEMEGWDETVGGIVYADAIEYRDYDVIRDRTGVSLTFDFVASESTDLYARFLYSKFDDLEERRRLVMEMDEEPTSGTATTAVFDSADGEISVRRGLKDRYETQNIRTFEFGGETEFDSGWEMDYSLSYAEASEHEYRTEDPTRFRRDFDGAGDLVISFDYSQLEFTPYSIVSSNGFQDASTYELNKMERVDAYTEEDETVFNFDFERDFDFADGEMEIKFGAKYRQKEKTSDVEIIEYSDYDAYTLDLVEGSQTYSLFDLGPLPDLNSVRAFNRQNLANFGDVELLFTDSNLDDFSIEEDVLAAFAQAEYQTENLMVIGGLRFEQTDTSMAGNFVDDDQETLIAQSFDNDYSNLLPSIAFKYNLSDEVVLRGGAYQSIVRPKLGKLAPRLETNDDDEVEAGNPNLQPYEANNLDLSLEYYFAPNAVVQGGIFVKDIENFIVDRVYDAADAPYNGVYNGVTFVEAVIPENGDNATVNGVELAYNQVFNNGIILGLNYTYTDAEGDLGDRTVTLPSTSEVTYNATLGYENERFSTRVTYSYRDDYLDELGSDAEEDRYVADQTKIDWSANYNVSDSATLFIKLANLNDTVYVAYQNVGGARRLLQYETYSWTGKLGVTMSF